MDIEKYLKKEKIEKSVSNLKANDRVKQKILDESKDTDYEKWLFSLERKSLVKKNIKIVIAMSIVVAFLILLMLYTVLSNRFMDKLVQSDNYITLDKGEVDGIRSEMGVVNGSGVVGIVYLTSPHYSIVIPVLNSKSSISCKIKRSDYFGFLKWDGGSSEFAFIKDMPRHSLFSLGDTIVTSGHSAVFPSGIPVGTVDDIADSHDGLSYLLRVKLFTDFARLNDVRVIAQKGQEEQLELEKQVKTTK